MKKLKSQKGFTLIEMLIVMLIITVLIAIAIPNVSKQTTAVDEKGCTAFVHIIGNIDSLIKKPVTARLSEVAKNKLIDSVYIIAYLGQKNKRKQVFSLELVALRKPLNNRIRHDVKHFLQSLDVSILQHRIGLFKGEEESFNRDQAVKTLFFVVHDEQPLSVNKKQVRFLRANAINSDIPLNKPFPVLVSDEWREQPLKVRWVHWLVAARVILFMPLGVFK